MSETLIFESNLRTSRAGLENIDGVFLGLKLLSRCTPEVSSNPLGS